MISFSASQSPPPSNQFKLNLDPPKEPSRTQIFAQGGSVPGGVGMGGVLRHDVYVSRDRNTRVFGEVGGSGIVGGPYHTGIRPNYGGIGFSRRF